MIPDEQYENPLEYDELTGSTLILARLVVLTILGMCAGLLAGILYGGYILVNLIIKLIA
jgi:hypothetical protein